MTSPKFAAWCFLLHHLLQGMVVAEIRMEEQFEHCCGLGSSWASDGHTCETFAGPVAGVARVEQGICLSAVDICCVRSYHERQCELGKSAARAGLACVDKPVQGGEYHRDCCEGCKLGILTGSMGQGCAFKRFAFGKPWDPAFLECCHETLRSTTELFTSPEISSTGFDFDNGSSPTTTNEVSPTSGSQTSTTPRFDDLCELMKGQLCTDICIPTYGSYTCACRKGFTLLEDGKTCRLDVPVDRCKQNNPCQQRCTDTGKTVVCSCNPGFTLGSDQRSCEYNNVTTISPESIPYRCPRGFRYDLTAGICDDVDECENIVCPIGVCQNTPGSYKCLIDTASEKKLESIYQDCPPGYVWNPVDFRCVDIDECLNEPCNTETHVCINTQGSYDCHELTGTGPRSCPAGFKFDTAQLLCTDVDECEEGMHGCIDEEEECRNTDGGYECYIRCQQGLMYSIGLGSCVDIDECATNGSALCPTPGSKCINSVGSYHCMQSRGTGASHLPTRQQNCPAGYKPGVDPGKPCIDVDECSESLHTCDEFERCVNDVGSYRCELLDTQFSETDDDSTEDYDQHYNTYPPSSETSTVEQDDDDLFPSDPTCLPGREYNRVKDTCDDIDECATNQHNCTGELLVCVNLEGTYRCDCDVGYELNITTRECQDIDECARGLTKCSIGERCVNSIGGHQCAPACPIGFQPHPTIPNHCQDIDECATGIHSCPIHTHICVNTNGSFVCDVAPLCKTGFARDEASGQCIDINECEKGPGCRDHERCVNMPGSYDCVPLCGNGWLYNPVIKGCQDVDECLLGRHNCPQVTHVCRNTNGSFACDVVEACPDGYRRDARGSCVDVDECLENVHNCLLTNHQYCSNRDGSFECITRYPACDRGFDYSVENKRCEDVDECRSERNPCNAAANERCVNLPGTYRCDRPARPKFQQQPACSTGYRYLAENRRCEDIDECTEGTHNCGRDRCYNQPGSFTCAKGPRPIPVNQIPDRCGPGLRLTAYGCADIDECNEYNDACSSYEDCVNTMGSYICSCKPGFAKDDVTQACVDINECQLQRHQCLASQRCDNTPGSYTCIRVLSCGTGYTLNAASDVCEDDDECLLGTHDCSNGYTCRNTQGSYRCDRIPRFTTVAPVTRTTRIYQTVTTTRHPFYQQPGVVVTRQPQILCPPGYESSNGQCVDIDECLGHNSCAPHQRCMNRPGSYLCMLRIRCGAGFKLDPSERQCIDIDECAERTHECKPSQTCENRMGGYSCICPPGHTIGPNKECVDVDECSVALVCGSNSRCENTIGSYRCICDEGFENVDNGACQDINECQRSPGYCQHSCINVWGSFRCACNAGFRLNLDNRSCTDVDECSEYKDNNLCVGFCQNTPGSYVCTCPSGYRLSYDGRTCQDIDECSTEQVCRGRDEICQNTRGHYRCNRIDCPAGYMRDTERRNRCVRTVRYCQTGDLACLRMPSHYSYNFMTFVSMLPIPPAGQIELFTMRGNHQFDSTVQFHMELVNVRAPANVQPARSSCFKLRRPSHSQAIIALTESLPGPQEIELSLSMEIYHQQVFVGSAIVKLFIYVSQYEF